MYFDVRQVRGDWRKVATRLEAEGQRNLRREVRKILSTETKPLRVKVRDVARADLPAKGGAGRYFATMPQMDYDFRGATTSVRLRMRKSGHDIKSVNDRGVIRHPLFGDRSHWYSTKVRAGFFDRAVEAEAPQIRVRIARAVEAYVQGIRI